MEDLCLLQASSGVTFQTENVGYLFNTRMLQLTASGQEHFGTPLLVKKLLTILMIVQFSFHILHFIVVCMQLLIVF